MHTKQLFRTLMTSPPRDSKSGPIQRPIQSKSLIRAVLLCAAAVGSLTSAGCQQFGNGIQYNQMCDEFFASKIAYCEAKQAWWSYRSRCSASDCLGDARRGFIAGYKSCAMGSDCRAPIVPERRYWSTFYQSGYGQQRINAWYEGFPMGVAAARVKGHGYHLRTPVTEEVSAYYAATSPMAMQEARDMTRLQEQEANPQQQTQAARQQPRFQSQFPTQTQTHTTAPVGQPFPYTASQPVARPVAPRTAQATRQPMLREYLDLPSETTELPAPADPFLSSDGPVNPFLQQDTPTAADFQPSIDAASKTVNRIAGDLPNALRPGINH